MTNKISRIIGAGIVVSGLMVGVASAQYYNYNNYQYGNNPNNGITSFIGSGNYSTGYNNNSYYDQSYYTSGSNYYNYNSGYNSYVQPVSVSSTGYNYYSGVNSNDYGYGYQGTSYYNSSTLIPTTYAATNVFRTGATINGYVASTGNNYNNNYGTTWFQYGLNQSSLNWSTTPANVYSSTNTNAYLTGLSCGTTYYFRAVTSGQNGTRYGNVLVFRTTSCGYSYDTPYNYNQYYQPTYYQNWQPPQVRTVCASPYYR